MQEFFEQHFTPKDGVLSFSKGDYDTCTFSHFDLTGGDLTGSRFLDCRFVQCNLTLARFTASVLAGVVFEECKLLGVRFDAASRNIQAEFRRCALDHSSFAGVHAPQTVFRDTRLISVDFSETNLAGSLFDNCDLDGARFQRTVLVGADLRMALRYRIDPEANMIGGARFSLAGLEGLLLKYQIHIEP